MLKYNSPLRLGRYICSKVMTTTPEGFDACEVLAEQTAHGAPGILDRVPVFGRQLNYGPESSGDQGVFRYCKKKKWIDHVPDFDKIPKDTSVDLPTMPLSAEEFTRLLDAIPKIARRQYQTTRRVLPPGPSGRTGVVLWKIDSFDISPRCSIGS
jgi:hypothetical protein